MDPVVPKILEIMKRCPRFVNISDQKDKRFWESLCENSGEYFNQKIGISPYQNARDYLSQIMLSDTSNAHFNCLGTKIFFFIEKDYYCT